MRISALIGALPFVGNFGFDMLAAAAMPEPMLPTPSFSSLGFRSPPFGKSKMTVARDARRSRKRKAKKRARRLGHA